MRKWQPAGWKKGRQEAEGETQAKDADFLISFASPDSCRNRRILHQLKEGVRLEGAIRGLYKVNNRKDFD